MNSRLRRLARHALVVLVAVVALIGIAPAASASPVPMVSTVAMAPPASVECSTSAPASELRFLPLHRWSDATTMFHTRLGSNLWDNPENKVQRYTQSGLMQVGNFFWKTSADMATAAERFCILDKAGYEADQSFAAIGRSVLGLDGGPMIVGLIIAGSLVVVVARARKQGGAVLRKLVTALGILAILVVMVNGAMKSTSVEGTDGASAYHPGKLSPGWVVSTTNGVLTDLFSSVAGSIAVPSVPATVSADQVMDCPTYTAYLTSQADAQDAAVAKIVSGLWVDSGMASWSQAQYSARTDIGPRFVSCHQLEMQAGVTPSAQASIWNSAAQAGGLQLTGDLAAPHGEDAYGTTAFDPADDVATDNSLVGWAACRAPSGAGAWEVESRWQAVTRGDGEDGMKGGKVTPDMCKSWFSEAGWNSRASALEHENGQQIKEATERAANVEARNFLGHLSGVDTTDGALASIAYDGSGIAMFFSFGLISLAILLGKVVQVVMMLLLIFALLASLWAGKGDDVIVSKFVRNFLGVTVFITLGSLLFAVLAILSRVIIAAGVAAAGQGSIISILWTGAGPFVAIMVVNVVLKAAGAPSPFKLNSAMAWGAAAGAVGGAAASTVQGWSDRGKSAARSATARATGKAMRGGGSGSGGGGGAGRGEKAGFSGTGAAGVGAAAGAGAGMLAGARGRKGSAADRLQRAGQMSAEERRRAQLAAAEKTPVQRQEDRVARAGELRAARDEARGRRQVDRDTAARTAGWKGERGENGRLRLRDAATRVPAVALGRTRLAVSSTIERVKADPALAAKAGLKVAGKAALVGGALVALPPVAGAALAGYGLVKGAGAVKGGVDRLREARGERQTQVDRALGRRLKARTDEVRSDEPANVAEARRRLGPQREALIAQRNAELLAAKQERKPGAVLTDDELRESDQTADEQLERRYKEETERVGAERADQERARWV